MISMSDKKKKQSSSPLRENPYWQKTENENHTELLSLRENPLTLLQNLNNFKMDLVLFIFFVYLVFFLFYCYYCLIVIFLKVHESAEMHAIFHEA